MTQTSGVVQILSGTDSGWKAQRRDDGAVPLGFAMRFHASHMAAGWLIALICWVVSPGLLMWMLPVIAGLVLAGPLNWLTGRPTGPALSALLATYDERDPPAILVRTRALTADWSARLATPIALPRDQRSVDQPATPHEMPRAA
jgi:membrane glycosyltransferase